MQPKRKQSQMDLGMDTSTPAKAKLSKLSSHPPKRLFRYGRQRGSQALTFAPEQEPDMSELVQFILAHEEAFQSRGRLASLYADFRSQISTNPEGYQANLAVWKKALADATRAGVVPAPGSSRNVLTISTGTELARALQHKDHGMPTCLPAVFQDALKRNEYVPVKEWKSSPTSIYQKSWLPSPWDALRWSVGKLFGPGSSDKLPVGTFVVVQNVEMAAESILEEMNNSLQTSTADRVFSKPTFLKRFSLAFNPEVPISPSDLDVLLTHMARDKQALSFDGQTVKVKLPTEQTPMPITQEDTALAELRDSLDRINAQLPRLHEKAVSLGLAAREAVQSNQMVRAKTALRSKKLAESAAMHQSGLVIQLEEAYMKLQQAADQVEIVEAMRAGAEAMNALHEKVGGAEGVQKVVDAVNEQVATTDEISNIINESAMPVDEGEIDDELEVMERVEKEKRETEAAAKTAARLEELAEAERVQKAKEIERIAESKEAAQVEENVDETSTDLSQLSVTQDQGLETEDEEKDGRVPVAA